MSEIAWFRQLGTGAHSIRVVGVAEPANQLFDNVRNCSDN